MATQYKIQLDVCDAKNPFDSWEQGRIRSEGEAVLAILQQVSAGESQPVSSKAEVELEQPPSPEKPEISQQLTMGTDLLLTPDERLLKQAARYKEDMRVHLGTPLPGRWNS